MILRCKVCGDLQPVSKADEADEDPRTRSIRQAFRSEHAERCGDGAVALQLGDGAIDPPDPAAWATYLASLRDRPDGVVEQPDGMFAVTILGVTQRVCEDCWSLMPPYRDFPHGLVSPESDGAGGAVPKVKPSAVQTENPDRSGALLHIRKAVCVPCYRAAYARVYPTAAYPDLSEALQPTVSPIGVDKDGDWISAPKPAPAEVG